MITLIWGGIRMNIEAFDEILHSAIAPFRMTDYDCAEYSPVRVGGLPFGKASPIFV